jgi:hypothetical protein
VTLIKAKFTVKVEKNLMPEILKRMQSLDRRVTKVGYPEGMPVGKPDRKADKKPKTEMSQIARIAFDLEFGAVYLGDKNWPVMSLAFLNNQLDIRRKARRLFIKVTQGVLDPLRAVEILGEDHTENIRNEIRIIRKPELSIKTIKRKKSDKPMIESGQMLNSVTHKEGKI